MDEKRRKRGKVSSFYVPILEGVYRLAKEAVESKMVRPVAIMLSFAFTDQSLDHPISNIVDRLRDEFRKVKKCGRKKASTFKLRYLWVAETKFLVPSDPEFEESLTTEEKKVYLSSINDQAPIPYPHHHMALILDDHKATWLAVRLVMQRLVEQGIVRAGFHFSENNESKEKSIKLKDEKGFSDYMYRVSYLAKTDTKDLSDRRIWSMSR